jgi:hypothetical protein
MAGYRTLLPPAEELITEINRSTLDQIGDQYGTSRQAVHKRLDKFCKATYGFGIKEYRERVRSGHNN